METEKQYVRRVYTSESILAARHSNERSVIQRLHDAGKAIHEIAMQVNRSPWYVRLVLEGDPCMKEQDSVRVTSTRRQHTNDDPKQVYQSIISLQRKGVSLRAISARFGRSRSWAHSYIRRFERGLHCAAPSHSS